MAVNTRPSDEFISLLRKSGDSDINVAQAAQREFAKALELPLRKGVLVGNILGNIFETINVEPGATTEYPLDLISPALKVSMLLTPILVMVEFQSDQLKVITS
jgi:hypothetical protein